MTEGAAQKFEKLTEILDRVDRYQGTLRLCPEDLLRISKALRLASAWLHWDTRLDEINCQERTLEAREAFRRALEGSPE